MGRSGDYKGSAIEGSRYLDRWAKDPERQDTPELYKRDVQRAVEDTVLSERHAGFDLSAQDNHSKFERPHFAVLGEGTKSANENYRQGYALIDWSK